MADETPYGRAMKIVTACATKIGKARAHVATAKGLLNRKDPQIFGAIAELEETMAILDTSDLNRPTQGGSAE